MQRDPRAFLWDVRESASAIQGFIAVLVVARATWTLNPILSPALAAHPR